MTIQEIEECKFINNTMKFYTLKDFVSNRKHIKEQYKKLKNPIFYKWFVYSNIHCTTSQKDSIWKYLNGEYDNFGYLGEEK